MKLTATLLLMILIASLFTSSAFADCQNLNSKAIKLVQPDYPVEARKAEQQGIVIVHIEVDESGSVIFAEARSGSSLLREAAERAALKTKFPAGRLSGDLHFKFVIQDADARGIIKRP